jgi:ATP-dependent Clp protease ATP-binding subunit ClpC
MNERFSIGPVTRWPLANLEAGKLNHGYLAPGHLMLGLIAEGECVATEALRLLDVDLDKVRDEVAARMGRGEAGGVLGRRAQTDETKEAIALAIAEARKFGHRYVGTEHPSCMLQLSDGLPSKVLRQQGVQLEPLREKAL